MSREEVIKKYGDIIELPHHQSAVRKHMGAVERASQFSPFAALTGLDDTMRATEANAEAELLLKLEHYAPGEDTI